MYTCLPKREGDGLLLLFVMVMTMVVVAMTDCEERTEDGDRPGSL
jgi:hypothetical protein